MADFIRMVPFIFHFAAGISAGVNNNDLRSQFELARKSGWSHDTDDPGGATMIDVTYSTFCYHRRYKGLPRPTVDELKNIGFEEWIEILKARFWDHMRADEIVSQGLANLCVDWIWASGGSVIKKIQSLAGVSADGMVGPKTLQALNGCNHEELFHKIKDSREAYYRRCRGAWKYLNGWLRRLNAILPDGNFKY